MCNRGGVTAEDLGVNFLLALQNVTFENCAILGEVLEKTDNDLFEINDFVDDIQFAK